MKEHVQKYVDMIDRIAKTTGQQTLAFNLVGKLTGIPSGILKIHYNRRSISRKRVQKILDIEGRIAELHEETVRQKTNEKLQLQELVSDVRDMLRRVAQKTGSIQKAFAAVADAGGGTYHAIRMIYYTGTVSTERAKELLTLEKAAIESASKQELSVPPLHGAHPEYIETYRRLIDGLTPEYGTRRAATQALATEAGIPTESIYPIYNAGSLSAERLAKLVNAEKNLRKKIKKSCIKSQI